MKKQVWIAAAAMALSICSTVPALAASWQRDGVGWWYLLDDGSYVKNGWKTIGGIDYRFNADGYLMTGWLQKGSQWMYFNQDGCAATNWLLDNGKWYYFDPNGVMRTGLLELGTKIYYLQANGSMAVGQKEIDGQIWYFESDGSAKKNSGTITDKNGVKYRYKDYVLERYNTNYNSWETVNGQTGAKEIIMQNLWEEYVTNHAFASAAEFAQAARSRLGSLMDRASINAFIEEVVQEYADAYSSY